MPTVKVISSISHAGVTYGPGVEVELPDEQAERLIRLGHVEAVASKSPRKRK